MSQFEILGDDIMDVHTGELIPKTDTVGRFLMSFRPSAPEARMFTHKLWLRKNLMLTLSLPVDLTVKEADRLSRMIMTLPIPAPEKKRLASA